MLEFKPGPIMITSTALLNDFDLILRLLEHIDGSDDAGDIKGCGGVGVVEHLLIFVLPVPGSVHDLQRLPELRNPNLVVFMKHLTKLRTGVTLPTVTCCSDNLSKY